MNQHEQIQWRASWCNGNTLGFDPSILSSNLSEATKNLIMKKTEKSKTRETIETVVLIIGLVFKIGFLTLFI